jgi:hypothetical protein
VPTPNTSQTYPNSGNSASTGGHSASDGPFPWWRTTLGTLLLLTLLALAYTMRRVRLAKRAARPSVVLAMPERTPAAYGGGPYVIDASELSSVELSQVDIVGTTTTPASSPSHNKAPGSAGAPPPANEALSSRLIVNQ